MLVPFAMCHILIASLVPNLINYLIAVSPPCHVLIFQKLPYPRVVSVSMQHRSLVSYFELINLCGINYKTLCVYIYNDTLETIY